MLACAVLCDYNLSVSGIESTVLRSILNGSRFYKWFVVVSPCCV